MAKVKIKSIASYNGHAIKTNKNIDVSFKFAYSELTNYVRIVQFLNEDIQIIARLPDDSEKFSLGSFRLKELKVEHDGEGIAKFNSMSDFVDCESLNRLVGTELLKVLFMADIELEEEDEGGE